MDNTRPQLASFYMTVQVSVARPATSAPLNQTAKQLAKDNGAEPDAFSARAKQIYKHAPLLKAPITIVEQYRDKARQMTSPWSMNELGGALRRQGPRLIHMEHVVPFMQMFAAFSVQYDQAVAAITEEEFNDQISKARQGLGDKADEVHWPTREQFLERCYMPPPEFSRLPADGGMPIGAAIPPEFVEAIDAHYHSREATMLGNALADRVALLFSTLDLYAKQIAPGGSVYASTRDKLLQYADDAIPNMLRFVQNDNAAPDPDRVENLLRSVRAMAEVDITDRRRAKDDDREAQSKLLLELRDKLEEEL